MFLAKIRANTDLRFNAFNCPNLLFDSDLQLKESNVLQTLLLSVKYIFKRFVG